MRHSTGRGGSDLDFAVGRAIAWCAMGYSMDGSMGTIFEQDWGRCVGKVFVIWVFWAWNEPWRRRGEFVICCDNRGVGIGVGGVQWEPFFVGIGGLDMQRGVYIGGLRPSVDIMLYLRDLEIQ